MLPVEDSNDVEDDDDDGGGDWKVWNTIYTFPNNFDLQRKRANTQSNKSIKSRCVFVNKLGFVLFLFYTKQIILHGLLWYSEEEKRLWTRCVCGRRLGLIRFTFLGSECSVREGEGLRRQVEVAAVATRKGLRQSNAFAT